MYVTSCSTYVHLQYMQYLLACTIGMVGYYEPDVHVMGTCTFT